jgi:hypothetical protein
MRVWRALFAVVALLAAGSPVPAQSSDAPGVARVLVIHRALQTPNHIYIAGTENVPFVTGRTFGAPTLGNSGRALLMAQYPRLNASFVDTVKGFDRDPAMATAIRMAFKHRAPFVEIATTADRDRYLTAGLSAKPTDAAHAEGFDFVLALFDNFVGLATRDEFDAQAALMTPTFETGYALFDAETGDVVYRSRVGSNGFARAPIESAVKSRDLFTITWPYLCVLNATEIAEQLLRADGVHAMAARVGRGADYPPVRDKIESIRSRLDWDLRPASGWRERKVNSFSRQLVPRTDLSFAVWMNVDVDFLLPELGQAVKAVGDFVPIHDRLRATLMPDSPLNAFEDVSAPDYQAYRYAAPGGEHKLVFFRRTGAMTVQIVTATFDGDFNRLYPSVRRKIEEMLAHSVVRMN